MYPSFGVTSYPYSDDDRKGEYSFLETLDLIVNWYSNAKRMLRNIYSWLPYEIDKINVDEIIRIVYETEIDNRKEGETEIDEDYG